MTSFSTTIRLLFLAAMLVLSGCGGGGGGGGGTVAGGAVAGATLFGVAATGAPIVGLVSLKDSSVLPVTMVTSTASDGSFAFSTAGLKPPFMLKTSSGGKNYYSISETGVGTTNVTPLTNLAFSVAAGGINLDTLFLNATPAGIAAAAANMPDAVVIVQSTLFDLFAQFGVDTATGSILTDPFVANHIGVDALMDAIDVVVAAGTVIVNNKSTGLPVFSGTTTFFVTASGTQMPDLSGTVTTANIPVPTILPGYGLYATNCSGCHGDISNSSLVGISTPATITNAIASGLGGMTFLSALTAPEINAIDLAINNPAGGLAYAAQAARNRAAAAAATAAAQAGGPTPGAVLYDANCLSCHGALVSSAKLGATYVRIQNAISGNVGGMGSLIALTNADMQAIEAALNPPVAPVVPGVPVVVPPVVAVTPVVDGATLYANNCAGCHQPLATSTKTGATIARFQNAVTNNIGNMRYLANLNVTEVQAIVGALTPANGSQAPTPIVVTPPAPTPGVPAAAPNGAALYASNCSGCHQSLATSPKIGMTTARFQTAVTANIAGMGVFSVLPAADVQAIVTALAPAVAPVVPVVPAPPVALSGATLYATNCQGCHGPLATSAKAGRTLAQTQAAIAANTGMMGYLSAVPVADLTSIAASLATVAPPAAPVVPACGSCHATPPAVGQHTFHLSKTNAKVVAKNITCATCHGTGYSTTVATNLLPLTHNNGTLNLAAGNPPGWTANAALGPLLAGTVRPKKTLMGSCTNACHGKKNWTY